MTKEDIIKEQTKVEEKPQRVIYPGPGPQAREGIWALNGWTESCLKADDPRCLPYADPFKDNGEENRSLEQDFQEFIRTKSLVYSCITVHAYDKPELTAGQTRVLEYVIRQPSDISLSGDPENVTNTLEDIVSYPFMPAKRFTKTPQNEKLQAYVKVDLVDSDTAVRIELAGHEILSESRDYIMKMNITMATEGIISIKFNDETISGPVGNGNKVVERRLSSDDFIKMTDELGIAPWHIFDLENTDQTRTIVYVHVAKEDEVVTLNSGNIVPALIKLNTYNLNNKSQHERANDITSHKTLGTPKSITLDMLDHEGDIWSQEYMQTRTSTPNTVVEPTVNPAFMQDDAQYRKTKFNEFAYDTMNSADEQTEDFDSEGNYIAKAKLYDISLTASRGWVASPRMTTSSLVWDSCSICGKGRRLFVYEKDYVNHHGNKFQNATAYRLHDAVSIKNKYLAALKLSGAYYNGELIEPKPVILVESTTTPEEGLDIHTNNVELLKDPSVMETIVETVNNPLSDETANFALGVPPMIRVNGHMIPMNARNSADLLDEVAQEPVILTTDQLEEPSNAANVNQIWAQYIAGFSFMSAVPEIFRPTVNMVSEMNATWKVDGIQWLVDACADKEELFSKLYSVELTIEDKLALLESSDNQRAYAALLSLYSYFIAAISFNKLLATIDFKLTTYDDIAARMAKLFKDGSIQALQSSFVDNMVASSLSTLFGNMLEEYIAFEGYKTFPDSGVIHNVGELGAQGSTVATEPKLMGKIFKGICTTAKILLTPVMWIMTGVTKMIGYMIEGSWKHYRNMYHRISRMSKDKWYLFALDVNKGFEGQDTTNGEVPANNLAWTTYDKEYYWPSIEDYPTLMKDNFTWNDSVSPAEEIYRQDIQFRNIILSWFTATNREMRRQALDLIEKNPHLSALGLFNWICSLDKDTTIKNSNGDYTYMYDQMLLSKEAIYNMMQQPVTTNIGKYKILFSSFDAIITASEDSVEVTQTQGAALRKIIGIKYDMEIGISADPDFVDSYGRWVSPANLKGIVTDTWEYTSRFTDTIRSFYDGAMDALRTKYFNNVNAYVTGCYLPSLVNPKAKVDVKLVTATIKDAEVLDLEPAEIKESVDKLVTSRSADVSEYSESSTFRLLHRTGIKQDYASLVNPFKSNKEKGLGGGIAKMAIGAAMMIGGIVMSCMIADKARAEQSKLKCSANASYGAMLKEIKQSYDLVNRIISDAVVLLDKEFDVQRTNAHQVYHWVGDDLNAADIAAIAVHGATAIAGFGLGVAGAVEYSNAKKLSRRAPDGSLLPKYQEKQKAKAEKKAAKKQKKSDSRYQTAMNGHNQKVSDYERSERELSTAESNYAAALQHGPNSPQAISAKAELDNKANNWAAAKDDLASSESSIRKASKKHAKKSNKISKDLKKAMSKISAPLSAAQMNKAERLSNTQNPKIDLPEDKYSKAAFDAITEMEDKTDDMFAKLMDSQAVFNTQDAKLDKILHRLKSLNNSGVGSSKFFSNMSNRRNR